MSSSGENNAPIALYIWNTKKIKHHDSLLSKYQRPDTNKNAGIFSVCADHLYSLRKMSLFTTFSCEASITVETAVVLPLFLLFFLSLSVFFRTLQVQSEKDWTLLQSAKEMAVLRYGKEEKTETSAGNDWITLRVPYQVKPLFSLVPEQTIYGNGSGAARAWIGGTGVAGQETLDGNVVYQTLYGTVYHTDPACTYLRPSISSCSQSELLFRRNADGEIYRGCELCGASENAGEYVFITENGNRYHRDPGCSGLKRIIYTVPREEAEGTPCSKCAGHGNS